MACAPGALIAACLIRSLAAAASSALRSIGPPVQL
jgi:hypothetical protein